MTFNKLWDQLQRKFLQFWIKHSFSQLYPIVYVSIATFMFLAFLFLFPLSLEYRILAVACCYRDPGLHRQREHKKLYNSRSSGTTCPAPQQSPAGKHPTPGHHWIWYGEGEWVVYQSITQRDGKRRTAALSSLQVEDSCQYTAPEKLI